MLERKANGIYKEMVRSLLQRREPHEDVWPIKAYAWLYVIAMDLEGERKKEKLTSFKDILTFL